ncbi:hypothetical protein ERJ75_001236700 [Trypanosoma vivax]|nr:hypothetical protein ERJ75_001236700 [Trypanosoma vivax]
MLTSAPPPDSPDPQKFLLPAFGVNVKIASRRLQAISYILAEVSSAATLLDDYVRTMLNTSHRLLAAWHSVAIAAHAASRRGEVRYHIGGGHRLHGTAHRGNKFLEEIRSHCVKVERAARHVECVRRLVVIALVQQFLRVTVDEENEDLVMRGLLCQRRRRFNVSRPQGSRIAEIADSDGGDRTAGISCSGNDFSGSANACPKSSSAHRQKRPRCSGESFPEQDEQYSSHSSFTCNAEDYLEVGDCTDSVEDTLGFDSAYEDDDSTCSSVSLQLFLRAAVALNPTACALRLISRCLMYVRHIKNVDDELGDLSLRDAAASPSVVPECSGSTENEEKEEGLFFVIVASRAIGSCEHSDLCFGNRKFFFVRYNERCNFYSSRLLKPSLLTEVLSSSTTLPPLQANECEEDRGAPTGDVACPVKQLSSNMAPRESPLSSALVCDVAVASRHGFDDTHSLPTLILPACVNRLRALNVGKYLLSERCEESARVSGVLRHNTSCAWDTSDPAVEQAFGVFEGRADRAVDSESRFVVNVEVDDGDDESEPQQRRKRRRQWIVVHSNRCSVTAPFFRGPTSSSGHLIAFSAGTGKSPESPQDSVEHSVIRIGHAVGSVDLPLDQAVFVPPSAAHGVLCIEESLAGQGGSTPADFAAGSIMEGHFTFADELLSRLEFWHARGAPLRRYYDPEVANAVGSDPIVEPVASAAESSTAPSACCLGAGGGGGPIPKPNHGQRTMANDDLPLKLLITQVGNIKFAPCNSPVCSSARGQQLLFNALAASTEVVVCSVRESRSHRYWHDHVPRRRRRRVCSSSRMRMPYVGGDHGGTFSSEGFDIFAVDCYEDVAVEALVQWAQGEVVSDEDGLSNGEFSLAGLPEGGPFAFNLPRSSMKGGRSLSQWEQNQRKVERLKIEFRLAHSKRLDALLVDRELAKPVAAISLVPSPDGQQCVQSDNQIVQETRFVVLFFSLYVSRLLRHLREEKVIMVDLDRTLVDNAIVAHDLLVPSFMSQQHQTSQSGRCQVECQQPKPTQLADQQASPLALEEFCETWKEVLYFVSDDPLQGMRSETIYVRRGIRRLLHRFAVEWGIPLFLVSKSSLRRTKAILEQVFDPRGELFNKEGFLYTAEALLCSESCRDPTHDSNEAGEDWAHEETHMLRQRLVNSKKSSHTVLQAWDRCASSTRLVPKLQRARSVVILDDTPQVWAESDWGRTVAVAPYTLNRRDPRGYFDSDGLIASMMLSTLYKSEAVVCLESSCPLQYGYRGCDGLRDAQHAVPLQVPRGMGRSSVCGVAGHIPSDGSLSDEESNASSDLHSNITRPCTPCFAFASLAGASKEVECVVEEALDSHEQSVSSSSGVEVVTVL